MPAAGPNACENSLDLLSSRLQNSLGETAVGNAVRVLVTGAGGFIGHHLVSFLRAQGYWVRGVDLKSPEFCATEVSEFECSICEIGRTACAQLRASTRLCLSCGYRRNGLHLVHAQIRTTTRSSIFIVSRGPNRTVFPDICTRLLRASIQSTSKLKRIASH